MKVTKYPQSCLVLEKDGRRLVIDPGNLMGPAFNVSQFGAVEATLYTHEHQDHYDAGLAKQLKGQGAVLYGNSDVVSKSDQDMVMVRHGQEFEAAGFRVLPYDLPHCDMSDGSAGPPNTGYRIDNHFFHPGDGTEITGITAEHVAAPIAGPSIGYSEAMKLVRDIRAKKVIPIHYDYFKSDPERLADYLLPGVELIVLAPGESAEL